MRTPRKILKACIVSVALMTTAGCMSIEDFNLKIKPFAEWTERSYEDTRFEQRYKFSSASEVQVKAAAIDVLSTFKLKLTEKTERQLVASGNLTQFFEKGECEHWKAFDEPKSKELSGGLISLSCNDSSTQLIAILSTRQFSSGTLITLEYEISSPQALSMGLKLGKRPTPAASKAGSDKFWALLEKRLGTPVRVAKKEDLQ